MATGGARRIAAGVPLALLIALSIFEVSHGLHTLKEADSLFFGAFADWGGQTDAPYTTAGQARHCVVHPVDRISFTSL